MFRIKIIALLLIGIAFLIVGIITFSISKYDSVKLIVMGLIFIIAGIIFYNKWIKKK